MISYETLDAINDMNPAEAQSVSVIQTGPGVRVSVEWALFISSLQFSYVTLSSSAPSFSKSLNGTEERAKSAVEEYRKELEPYVNGKMLSPEIFVSYLILMNSWAKIAGKCAFSQWEDEKSQWATGQTQSWGSLLLVIVAPLRIICQVDDFLHKDHPKSSVEAAKAIQSKPEEKEKLNEAMENATMYSYVPMVSGDE